MAVGGVIDLGDNQLERSTIDADGIDVDDLFTANARKERWCVIGGGSYRVGQTHCKVRQAHEYYQSERSIIDADFMSMGFSLSMPGENDMFLVLVPAS